MPYTKGMAQVTLDLPDELAAVLEKSGNLERAALEAIALEAYQSRRLTAGQLRRVLGLETRVELDALLKERGIYWHYDEGDLQHDISEAGRLLDHLQLRPK